MCDILETAGRRVKRTKIWAPRVSSVCRVLLTVKCTSSILGSFGVFPIFADFVHVLSWKGLVIQPNGPKFGLQGKQLHELVYIEYF